MSGASPTRSTPGRCARGDGRGIALDDLDDGVLDLLVQRTADPVGAEPLPRLGQTAIAADLPASAEAHGCTSFRVWLSGSRSRNAFVKPSTASVGATTSEDSMVQLP